MALLVAVGVVGFVVATAGNDGEADVADDSRSDTDRDGADEDGDTGGDEVGDTGDSDSDAASDVESSPVATNPLAPATTTTVRASTTTLPPVTTTNSGPPERVVTLLVDVAKLRAEPRLDAAEIDSITDLAGASIVVVGEPSNGWYRVRIGFQEGWMFGAFILPPADGLIVLQTRSTDPVILRDSAGVEMDLVNASGSYALATSTSGNLWPVVLPEGWTAYVQGSEMNILS
ncbi:MAG: SH3 domain-containing protein [Acidimicrobiales bacterium]